MCRNKREKENTKQKQEKLELMQKVVKADSAPDPMLLQSYKFKKHCSASFALPRFRNMAGQKALVSFFPASSAFEFNTKEVILRLF